MLFKRDCWLFFSFFLFNDFGFSCVVLKILKTNIFAVFGDWFKSNICFVVLAGQQPPSRNPPTWRRLDAAGEATNTIRTTNNREKQSTQYLTRFGNVPTSSGQGRERFY